MISVFVSMELGVYENYQIVKLCWIYYYAFHKQGQNGQNMGAYYCDIFYNISVV